MPYPNYVPSDPLYAADVNTIIARLSAVETKAQAAQDTANAAFNLIPGNNTVNVGALGGTISLSQFTGTHDQKLAAAFSYAAAQTYVPAILLEPAINWTFNNTYPTYDGLRLIGNPVVGFHRKKQLTKVTLNCGIGPASFLVGATTTYNGLVADISFQGSGTEQFFHQPGSAGTAYGWVFRNLMFDSMKHVIGMPTDFAALTLCVTSGDWNTTTPQDSQYHIRGSDNAFWINSSCNLSNGDVPATGGGKYLMRLASLEKSPIGGVYFTAYQGWRALEVTGTPSFGAGLRIDKLRCEGRNTADPCYGSLIKVKSGFMGLRDSSINFAMANPTGHPDETDLGVIEVGVTAKVRIHDCNYDRASTPAVAETVPFLYVKSGGKAKITDIDVATKGGAWTGLPRVFQAVNGGVIKDETTQFATGSATG
jgi:hypothetical protein